MREYNKSIEELLNYFENLQVVEIVKQVNMQLRVVEGTDTQVPKFKGNYF